MPWFDLTLLTDPRETATPTPAATTGCRACPHPRVHAHGLCRACYRRERAGNPLGTARLTCVGCGQPYDLGRGTSRERCASCLAKLWQAEKRARLDGLPGADGPEGEA